MAKGRQNGSSGSQLSASSGYRAPGQSSVFNHSVKYTAERIAQPFARSALRQLSAARRCWLSIHCNRHKTNALPRRPRQIDIQIEPKPGTNRLVITGQLLDLSNPGVIGRDIQITLSNNRGNTIVAATNQFGEFSSELENTGDLELIIPGEAEEPIVISLRECFGQPTRRQIVNLASGNDFYKGSPILVRKYQNPLVSLCLAPRNHSYYLRKRKILRKT